MWNLKLDRVCLCETANFDKIYVVENLADMGNKILQIFTKVTIIYWEETINSQDNSENKSLLIKSLIRRVKKII